MNRKEMKLVNFIQEIPLMFQTQYITPLINTPKLNLSMLADGPTTFRYLHFPSEPTKVAWIRQEQFYDEKHFSYKPWCLYS